MVLKVVSTIKTILCLQVTTQVARIQESEFRMARE